MINGAVDHHQGRGDLRQVQADRKVPCWEW